MSSYLQSNIYFLIINIDNNLQINTSEVTSNNAMYKKNAMAFDINFNDKKRVNTIENKPKTEVIPNEESPNTNIEETRYECPNCGRKFKREAYRKHVPICQRVFQGKKDIDVSNKDKRNSIKDSDLFESKSKPLKKNSKWENQSNELRAIIQSKRAEKGKKNY